MGKDDDDGPDSEKEWKSSHDRFVEALERFAKKAEEAQAKQERTANGFYIEISRKELREHLDERALHYGEEAFKLTEQGVHIPPEYKLPDGSPMIGKDGMDILEREHKKLVEHLNGKAKTFAFAARHLPDGKETFVLDLAMCANLELIPNV